MAAQRIQFSSPDRFIACAVGNRSNRLFFIQSRDDDSIFTAICEEAQLRAISESIDSVLNGVARVYGTLVSIPAKAELPVPLPQLESPIGSLFHVSSFAVGWQMDAQMISLLMYPDGSEHEGGLLTGMGVTQEMLDGISWPVDSSGNSIDFEVILDPGEARKFAALAREVVLDGREPCPLCAMLVDATGHICPKANGYRPELFKSLYR